MLPLIAKRGFNLVGKPFGINPFPRSFANPVASGDDRQAVFDSIYRDSGWESAESRSGVGSEIARTRSYLTELEQCLSDLQVRTIFDAPCGDLNWIRPIMKGRSYIGGDISAALIDTLHERFPDIDTRVFDICENDFPRADVWHCRDCLFHLPFAAIRRAFERFAESTIPYALLTTHRSRWLHRNLDAPIGGFRYLDLEKSPISLGRPQRYLADYRPMRDFPRYLGLWRREDVKQALLHFR